MGVGALVDIKTTRSLSTFSPFVVTRWGYYRQMGWYKDGLHRLGREVENFYFIAIESAPPYDVGVFALEPDAVEAGRLECDGLFERLEECEAKNEWPGQFPELASATIMDSVALPEAISEEE